MGVNPLAYFSVIDSCIGERVFGGGAFVEVLSSW